MAIRVAFYEYENVVEIGNFESMDDLLKEEVDDMGTRIFHILTPRKEKALRNGRMVRFPNPHCASNGIKILLDE